jgi:hypothetical protein
VSNPTASSLGHPSATPHTFHHNQHRPRPSSRGIFHTSARHRPATSPHCPRNRRYSRCQCASSSSGREEGSNDNDDNDDDDDDDVVIVDGSDDADAKKYSNDPSMPLKGKSVSRPNVDGGAKGGRRITSPARKTSHIHDEGKAMDDDVGDGMENGGGIDVVIPHSLLN